MVKSSSDDKRRSSSLSLNEHNATDTDSNSTRSADFTQTSSYTDNQKHLLLKCIKLINHGRVPENTVKKDSSLETLPKNKIIPNINVNWIFIKFLKIFFFYLNFVFFFFLKFPVNEDIDENQTSSPMNDTQPFVESNMPICSPIVASSSSNNLNLNRLSIMNSIKSSTSSAEISK